MNYTNNSFLFIYYLFSSPENFGVWDYEGGVILKIWRGHGDGMDFYQIKH